MLDDLIAKANAEAGLNIQACYDEPDAFNTFMAHCGKFEGVTNYIALVAAKNKDEKTNPEVTSGFVLFLFGAVERA